MYDALFQALAQAKSQPSHALRAVESGGEAAGDVLGGYLQGRQIRAKMAQPGALAQLYGATPEGQAVEEQIGQAPVASAFYGLAPKDALDLMAKQSQLSQQMKLGQAGITERNTASQRMADAAAARTNAYQNNSAVGLYKNLDNEATTLMRTNANIAPQLPKGLTGVGINILNNLGYGDIGKYATNPSESQAMQNLISNNQRIKQIRQQQLSMGPALGVPQPPIDSSDLGGIAPPPTAGGDSSIVTGLPGFGD